MMKFLDFFKKENFEIKANSYFNIDSDIDIGKVDPNYLYEVLSEMDLKMELKLYLFRARLYQLYQ